MRLLCIFLVSLKFSNCYRHYRDHNELERDEIREIIEDYIEDKLEDDGDNENPNIEVDGDDLDEFLFKSDPIRLTGRRSWRGRKIVREVTRPIRQTVDVIRKVVRVVPRVVRTGLDPAGLIRFRSRELL